MANLFHSRGVLGVTILFCSSASLFLGILGICLLRIWTNTSWESPPLWTGVTGLVTGMLGIASSRLNSKYLTRWFVASSTITTMTTCSGIGVLIVQLSSFARRCETAQYADDVGCNRKLIILSAFIFCCMLLVLLLSLGGVSFWGRTAPKSKITLSRELRAPEHGVVLVSSPHSDTHHTLVPVKCQFIPNTSSRDHLVLTPWTLPSSSPGYSNRLSSAFNVNFSAGGPRDEEQYARYVPLK